MTSHDTAPRGFPAWALTLLQAANGLIAVGALGWWSHAQLRPGVLLIGALVVLWACVRPEGWGTWLLLFGAGAWWILGAGKGTPALALGVGLALMVGHHLAALRAALPARARITLPALWRMLAAHLAVLTGSAAAMLLVAAASGQGGGGHWRLLWPAVAFAAITGLVAFTLRITAPASSSTAPPEPSRSPRPPRRGR